MTYIYVMPLHEEYNGYGVLENGRLPPPQPPSNEVQSQPQEPPKTNVCTRLLTSCKEKISCNRSKNQKETEQKQDVAKSTSDLSKSTGCFSCRRKQPNVIINIENEEPKKSCWDKVCCRRNKVRDTTSGFSTGNQRWNERKNSILSDTTTNKSRSCCTRFWRKAFCLDQCNKKKRIEEEHISRRASMLSKKKSLTPDVQVEDHRPKIDISLVEHTSQMKAAIPILPVGLAWFCLVMNCIGPGTGTVLSGLFCLCIGIPRFSQKDGPRPRIGAFIIDLIIGFSQFFTVLFCLVGWGWSIWWGVIMVKIAKKHRKIKALEAQAEEASRPAPTIHQNHRDAERGS